jgi:hypothetical protein
VTEDQGLNLHKALSVSHQNTDATSAGGEGEPNLLQHPTQVHSWGPMSHGKQGQTGCLNLGLCHLRGPLPSVGPFDVQGCVGSGAALSVELSTRREASSSSGYPGKREPWPDTVVATNKVEAWRDGWKHQGPSDLIGQSKA